jgi:hypothetical protein
LPRHGPAGGSAEPLSRRFVIVDADDLCHALNDMSEFEDQSSTLPPDERRVSDAASLRISLFRTLSPGHRRLLAGLTALSVAAAVWVVEFNQQQMRVNRLYAAITAGGGAVSLEAPLWRKYVASLRGLVVLYQDTHVVLKGETFDDEWLRDHDDLTAFKIDWLNIDNCPLTAAGLNGLVSRHPIGYFSIENVTNCDAIAAVLTGEQTLWCASFDGTDLSDSGFRKLPLARLVVVSMQGTRVTSTGLLELRRCRRLDQVWLDGRQFDERVAELLRMQGTVSSLFLDGKNVTDEHLSLIQGLRVQWVQLTDTSATPEGVSALRKSMPGCRVRVYSTTANSAE